MDTLCRDTVYFANPGSFNDPLDCNPTLECDSPNEDLRNLLVFLVRRRVAGEVLTNLERARIKGESATEYAKNMSHHEATNELQNIAYHAINPEYDTGVSEAKSWLLVQEIERELHRYYERGVCCFSSTELNPLLWSHYGDQHKGLCIGYGVDRKPEPRLREVEYGGGRAIKTSSLIGAFLEKNIKAQLDLDRDVLLRKAEDWKYESEWRLIGKQGVQDSPLLLKEVVFGLRCSSSIMHAVVRVLAGRDNAIEFFKIDEARDSYTLCRRALDVDELEHCLPKTARSGIEIFGPVTGGVGVVA